VKSSPVEIHNSTYHNKEQCPALSEVTTRLRAAHLTKTMDRPRSNSKGCGETTKIKAEIGPRRGNE